MSRLVVAWLASTPPEQLKALYNDMGWEGSASAQVIHEAAREWLNDYHPQRAARLRPAARISKYKPLHDHLAARRHSMYVGMTLGYVEELIGDRLPPSAFKYREWWANQVDTSNRPQAAAWLDAGFEVNSVDQTSLDGRIEFKRRPE